MGVIGWHVVVNPHVINSGSILKMVVPLLSFYPINRCMKSPKGLKMYSKTDLHRLLVLLVVATITASAFVACAGDTTDGSAISEPTISEAPATNSQPYAGLQNRPIKAIDPDRVEDLLAGRGAGFALTAELNSYPGPVHVLKMAETLKLSGEQKREVQGLFDAMSIDAKVFGSDLVDFEIELDRSFSEGTIDQAKLVDLTRQISGVEGQLRALHLGTHLTMVNILSDHQIVEYDRLRGYSGASGDTMMDHSNMTGQQ